MRLRPVVVWYWNSKLPVGEELPFWYLAMKPKVAITPGSIPKLSGSTADEGGMYQPPPAANPPGGQTTRVQVSDTGPIGVCAVAVTVYRSALLL